MKMLVVAVLMLLLLLLLLHGNTEAAGKAQQASPAGTASFSEGFSNLWGPQKQTVAKDQTVVNLTLDRSSGSGIKAKRAYLNGYFGVSIKVQPGNTTGVNTAFFLSNNEQYQAGGEEIAVEVLGGHPPSTLRTNVHCGGTSSQMLFRLWFDPAAAFHRYALLRSPGEVVFLVDDVPVRRYEKKKLAAFPDREMWVYASVWDASNWSTSAADYASNGPFTSRFQEFRLLPAAHGRRRGLELAPISYTALGGADQITCSKKAGTEANCRPGGGKPAAPYTRGCTFIQRCAPNIIH